MLTPIQAWVATLVTLGVLSYLYKENPVFRLLEHVMLGLSTAHILVMSWHGTGKMILMKYILEDQKLLYIIPVVGGLLIYTRFFPKIAWIARIPMSYWVGYGIGYSFAYDPRPMLGQIIDSFIKFQGKTPGVTVNNILFFIFLTCSIAYFFFTIKRENPLMNVAATIGRYAIMAALGAGFGGTVISRAATFYGRAFFLLKTFPNTVFR
ncbi:MAG: hypothetical protein AB1492_03180 [Bacillota bacterium]